jgi:hypothetical protein
MPLNKPKSVSRNIRKQWKKDKEKAIIAVREKMGTLKAAKFFKVPRTTLQTLAKKVTLPPKQTAATKLRKLLEQNIVKCILEDKFYGSTRNDLTQMAYTLASINGLKHPFGSSKLAGRAWLDLFLWRHRNVLPLHGPCGTSFARA